MSHLLNDFAIPTGKVAVHWFGQSSFAIKTPDGTIILIDPYFPRDRPEGEFIHREPPIDESMLQTDAVLLTHDHSDHTCVESLARVAAHNPSVRIIGPIESANRLQHAGLVMADDDVLTAGDERQVHDSVVHAVYAKPPDGDPTREIPPPDVTHLGYIVEVGRVRLWFTGDPINSFAELVDLVNPVKALNPDTGFLTTHPTEGEFPFFDGSVEMARRVGLKMAVPSHYDCFTKRTYDPNEWAAGFSKEGDPRPFIIPYNTHALFPLKE